MELKYDRRSQNDRRDSSQSESFPLQDSDGKTIETNRRLKGDRRTEGLELSVSDMPDDEFSKYFDQFEKEGTLIEEKSTNGSSEKWGIVDYKVLYREDAEIPYLVVVHTDDENMDTSLLFAFRKEDDESDERCPTKVQHMQNGGDTYQFCLEHGWKDLTHSEKSYPWQMKSWLAQRIKQDTI